MANASEEIRRIHIYRFRFTTDGGDAYAVVVLDDAIPPLMWRVGFAFREPRDNRRVMQNGGGGIDLGYVISSGRAFKAIVDKCETMAIAERTQLSEDMDVRKELRKLVIGRILCGLERYDRGRSYHSCSPSYRSELFGLRPYRGKGKGDFEQWITGKFADQFRARYAGGV